MTEEIKLIYVEDVAKREIEDLKAGYESNAIQFLRSKMPDRALTMTNAAAEARCALRSIEAAREMSHKLFEEMPEDEYERFCESIVPGRG